MGGKRTLDAPTRAAESCFQRDFALGDALVQPFVEEVASATVCEYSLTFIDGSSSHSTLKRATAGEFRVQTEHGGTAAEG